MLETIKFGKVPIGDEHPCVVIAEGCDNHGGSLTKAKEMAHAAKEAGADIIKFQLHLPEEEMVKSEIEKMTSGGAFAKWGSLYGFVEKHLLKAEKHRKLKEHCEKIGIQYFCTPFSLKAAEILKSFGADCFKIGSGETEDLPMIEEIAKMGLPMMISTGMTTLDELDSVVSELKVLRTPFCLAHCISVYPVKKLSQLSFGTVAFYRERYGVHVGWSDHTPPEGITDENGKFFSERELIGTVLGCGARFIEKHFTLDRSAKDADSYFSHDPKTLKRLVGDVRHWEEALRARNGKILDEEVPVREWAKRSLVAACDIEEGAFISRRMLTSKRPGNGIRSNEYKKVIGMKTKRAIRAGTMISWDDFYF